MPDSTDRPAVERRPAGPAPVLAQESDGPVQPSPGLTALLAEARETWISRARAATGTEGGAALAAAAGPGWRPFEDAFPTFYQFTNRPR